MRSHIGAQNEVRVGTTCTTTYSTMDLTTTVELTSHSFEKVIVVPWIVINVFLGVETVVLADPAA